MTTEQERPGIAASRRFQFRLRTLLIVMAVLAVPMAIIGTSYRSWQRSKAEALEALERERPATLVHGVPRSVGEWRWVGIKHGGHLYRRVRSRQDVCVVYLEGPPRTLALEWYVYDVYTPPFPVSRSAPSKVVVHTNPSAVLKSATFTESSGGTPRDWRVYWSWYIDGVWTAPDSPRLSIRDRKDLRGMYMIVATCDPDDESDCESFLAELIPQLPGG